MGDTFNLNLDDHYDNATREGHVQLGRWRTLTLWFALLMIATLILDLTSSTAVLWWDVVQPKAGVTLNVIFVRITLAVMGAAQVCLSHFS
jgi:hypothetical protein